MTAYSAEGHQDGLEGITGTWAFPGVHCEECHGPGGGHAGSVKKEKIGIDRASAACGKCHIRGAAEKIPAKKGFIRHHEQYNEYLASPHAGKIQCITCHDPHKPARFGIRTQCGSCHSKQAQAFEGSSMQRAGVACIDCHMPRASKSAEAMSPTEGDVRTHNWKINADPSADMFTEDGKYVKGFLTLNVVCLNCHGNRDIKWAAKNAKKVHGLGK
jgi:formate-dependent nitrite reductase cytochrome c552 subunit